MDVQRKNPRGFKKTEGKYQCSQGLEILIPMVLAGEELSETGTIPGQHPKPISNSVAALKDEVIIRA